MDLAFWSVVALISRVIAILGFIYIIRKQFLQFRKKQLYPNENALKRLLVSLVVMMAVSNLPIMLLHWQRIIGTQGSEAVTSFATVTNALSMLAVAVILILIYGFRGEGEDR